MSVHIVDRRTLFAARFWFCGWVLSAVLAGSTLYFAALARARGDALARIVAVEQDQARMDRAFEQAWSQLQLTTNVTISLANYFKAKEEAWGLALSKR